MLSNKFKKVFQISARVLLTAFICCLFLVSNLLPAQAADSSKTSGEAKLKGIQERTEEIKRPTAPSMDEMIEKTKGGGINEVQGTAEREKMISPEKAQQESSPEEQTKGFLEKLTNPGK
ncbi:hypothetical protein IQ238_14745 [Pleurocapsales cyanobacterium LEGE 06147]|nr:hypothetical protein [Pleurocapsales cyanobacterium LEGE 06147]